MIFHVLLTHEQYWTAAFVLFILGWMYTAKTLFRYPDEVKE